MVYLTEVNGYGRGCGRFLRSCRVAWAGLGLSAVLVELPVSTTIAVSQEVAAQAVPVLGAIGGAACPPPALTRQIG
jgi:hypothetical protein